MFSNSTLEAMRVWYLLLTWPILLLSSIFLYKYGRDVTKLIKGDIIGTAVYRLIVLSIAITFVIGAIGTEILFRNAERVYFLAPLFLVWLLSISLTLRAVIHAYNKIRDEVNALPPPSANINEAFKKHDSPTFQQES